MKSSRLIAAPSRQPKLNPYFIIDFQVVGRENNRSHLPTALTRSRKKTRGSTQKSKGNYGGSRNPSHGCYAVKCFTLKIAHTASEVTPQKCIMENKNNFKEL
ncbi:MAG TPA: hypothetical protein PKW95_20485 [bacterium]|nr:hypothetical protein [bacterium]